MKDWHKIMFVMACACIISMSVAITIASYAEIVIGEPIYAMAMKVFMGIATLCGLIIGLLKIPKKGCAK